MNTPSTLLCRALLTVTATLVCATAATAAGNAPTAEAQARFRQEMAVCNSGQSNQEASVCRIEARAALQVSRSGGLDDAHGQYQRNALARCNAFQGADRSDCEARMSGSASTSGSARDGGILRSIETTVPAN